MLVNVNGIYYVHVCEQMRWAHSAGSSTIENLCIYVLLLLYMGFSERIDTILNWTHDHIVIFSFFILSLSLLMHGWQWGNAAEEACIYKWTVHNIGHDWYHVFV